MKVRFAVSVGLATPDPTALADVVGRVEAEGFDTLWMSDLPSLPATEPGLGVAYAAAITSRVRLGINLIPFGATPYAVAHRLAQLDRLTGGRLLITLVPGLDLPGERHALGTAGRHRGRMIEELVPQLREWWAGRPAATGPGGDAGDAGVTLPVLPLQQPLELWLGGAGPEAIGRAGRVADGWLGSFVSPGRAGEIRRAIEAEAAAAGRSIDGEHFGLSIGYAREPEDMERAARRRPFRSPAADPDADPGDLVPVGGPALRLLIGRLVEQGLSKFVLRPVAPPPEGAWAEELAWMADTVLDLQT